MRSCDGLFEQLPKPLGSFIQTPRPKILRAKEAMLSQIEVAGLLRTLRRAISEGDCALLNSVIKDRIEPMPPPKRIKRNTAQSQVSKEKQPV